MSNELCQLLRRFVAAVWLPVLMVYFVMMGGTFGASLNGSMRVVNQALTATIVLGFLVSRLRTGPRPLDATVRLPAFLLIVSTLLSATGSGAAWLAREPASQGLWYLSVFALTWHYAGTDEGATRLTCAVTTAALLAISHGATQYLGWLQNPAHDTTMEGQRYLSSSFNTANDYAGYLVMVLPLLLACGADKKRRRSLRVLSVVGGLIGAICLIFTYSRAGWLGAFVAGVMFVFWFLRRTELSQQARRRMLVLIPTIVVGLVVVAFVTPQSKVADRLRYSLTSKDTGTTGRLAIYRTSLAVIKDRPFLGWGPGLFVFVYPRYLTRQFDRQITYHAHNVFLQVAADLGLIGLICYLWLIGAVFGCGWRRRIRDVTPQTSDLALAAAVIGYLLYSQFNCCLAIPNITATFWILLALLARPAQHETHARDHPGFGWGRQVRCAVLFLAAFFFLFHPPTAPYNVVRSDTGQLAFDLAFRSGELTPDTIPQLDRAIASHPSNAFYHAQRGYALHKQRLDVDGAIAEYRHALKLFEGDSLHHQNLGWLLMEQGKPSEALQEFKRSLQLDPALPALKLNIAEALTRLGRASEAASLYAEAAKGTRLSAVAEYVWGGHCEQESRPGEAAQHFANALRLLPDGALYQGYQVGMRYRRVGLKDEVISGLPKLETGAPVHVALAGSLAALGRVKEAERHYVEALKAEPGYAPAQEGLRQLLLRIKG